MFIIRLIYYFFDNYYFLFDLVLVVIGFFLFMNSNDINMGYLINYMLIMGLYLNKIESFMVFVIGGIGFLINNIDI